MSSEDLNANHPPGLFKGPWELLRSPSRDRVLGKNFIGPWDSNRKRPGGRFRRKGLQSPCHQGKST